MTFWPERIYEKSIVRRSNPEAMSDWSRIKGLESHAEDVVDGTEWNGKIVENAGIFSQHPRAFPADDGNAEKWKKETSAEKLLPALPRVPFSEQLHPYMFPKWQKVSSLQNRIFQSENLSEKLRSAKRYCRDAGEQIGHAIFLCKATVPTETILNDRRYSALKLTLRDIKLLRETWLFVNNVQCILFPQGFSDFFLP